ncbi:unnamed protein product [Medioppia subpectinata]|uniref:Ribonucleotide reductase large subunit C-terminal domain-containing protein n=1 Tax=Medioppia subpectinata TaxID=1979941 RepID=A0A7R9KEC6_9ACAR|nr:unnamed protein product [Medioppia subpectinata]CAG2101790.1 unnamed protein product [Medioppia subpectinata]
MRSLDYSNYFSVIPGYVREFKLDKIDVDKFLDKISTGMASNMSKEDMAKYCSEMAASMFTEHPQYIQLAAVILTSYHSSVTINSFSEKIKLIQKRKDIINDDIFQIIMDNSETIDQMIDYSRDYTINYSDMAVISKLSGGLGLHMHNVRSRGSKLIQSGGASKGLEEHRAREIFQALWINDLFMERVENGDEWSLFDPNTAPGLDESRKIVSAQSLWKAIISSQIETGTPYMVYKDSANRIDTTVYPLDNCQKSNLDHRPVGLDQFKLLGLDSTKGRYFKVWCQKFLTSVLYAHCIYITNLWEL